MSRIVVASTRRAAGKTSLILAIGRHTDSPVGYIKPLGDRLYYRKKRLWDHDAALCTSALTLGEPPEDITIGFEQSKLRFMYDKEGIAARLRAMAVRAEPKDGILFIEAGQDCAAGASVHLDPWSVAETLDARVIVVASGDEATVPDDLAHLKRVMGTDSSRLVGVVINKVPDAEDFGNTTRDAIAASAIPVLGIVPSNPDLTRFSMAYLADYLFAKLVAGDAGLDNVIQSIYVGAMSADELLRSTYVNSPSKLFITSGDRSDIILAALETKAAGVVLTNNILPPANILSRASHAKVPLLLVPSDTYQTAKRVDDIEPLLRAEEEDRIDVLCRFVAEHVDMDALIGR